MILSILICSLEERKDQLLSLVYSLQSQIIALGVEDEVEILSEVDNRQITTGAKRNKLLKQASGKYVTACDDDDSVSMDYIEEILLAAAQDPDCITFNGYMTTDGRERTIFNIALNNPYMLHVNGGQQVYLRFPNHICPIKREIALQVPFQDISFGEDYKWAKEIKDRGLLKTEVKIEKELYWYKFVTGKKR